MLVCGVRLAGGWRVGRTLRRVLLHCCLKCCACSWCCPLCGWLAWLFPHAAWLTCVRRQHGLVCIKGVTGRRSSACLTCRRLAGALV